ncbi:hypothetical protein Z043_116561 [Scleropages formosus]|uniref:Uncharacterized protein n=1 Tax=Scleropages formosus TaxID=113540 RepID=A0A0P7UST2_SCLFO|nr:hypothetical protein Z043_116561 [Scleropages formosus]
MLILCTVLNRPVPGGEGKRSCLYPQPDGGALRLPCKPTSSATGAHPRASAKQACGTAARPQKRSAEMCRAGDSYTRDKFLPSATSEPVLARFNTAPGDSCEPAQVSRTQLNKHTFAGDLEKEKRRLQNIFATGNEKSDTPRSHHVPEERGDEEETDRFQEVLDEIEERKQFLEEMTALGKGKYYQNIITTEISQVIPNIGSAYPSRAPCHKRVQYKRKARVHLGNLVNTSMGHKSNSKASVLHLLQKNWEDMAPHCLI